MAVPKSKKTMPANRPVLKALHHGALKLDDPPTFNADHVVMVGPVGLELKFRPTR